MTEYDMEDTAKVGIYDSLRAEIERLTAALEQIDAWSRAYPLSVFPKPGLERAADLLRAGGMTLDAISASAMRYAIEGVGQIAPRH
jgi:hypothetical protein